MKYRGVIFDMDGTITAPYLEFAAIKSKAGIGDVDMLDYLRNATGQDYERVHSVLMKFEEDGVANAKLNRGARTVLTRLKRKGIPTGLLTRNSRKSVDGVCAKLKLRFDITITREDGPHKPSPEPIWSMARQWGVKPQEVLMVGDYKWDVMCAQNAGSPCVVLLNGDPLPEWARGADHVIHRLTELLPIVEGKR
jgi:HAD superfamily hydrolase (TIGR01549 family)